MHIKFKALSVHLLTATGAVLSMFAMLAAVEGSWQTMFLWLVLALLVDGIDGPLARRFDTPKNFPIYDGVLMDLIVDYLTYVFIPAYALFKSGMLTGWTGWLAIIAICYGSVIYFSDTRMKTKDKSFSGFPACWNMVVLVLFAVAPSQNIILAVVVLLTVGMFLPLKFVHPPRTMRWREVTLPVSIAWVGFAGWAAWVDFAEGTWAHWGLVATSVYLVGAGIAQQIIPPRPRRIS